MRIIHHKIVYSIKRCRVGNRALKSLLKVLMLSVDLSFLKITFWKSWALVVILGIISVPGFAQTLVFSSTNPAVSNANLVLGSVKQPIYRAVMVASGANGGGGNLTQVTFTPSGTFTASDINKYQFWYSTTDDLSTAVTDGPDVTTIPAPNNLVTFTVWSPWLANATYYMWITADISVSATNGHNLTVAALTTSNFTISPGTKSGTMYIGGTQTIGSPSPAGPQASWNYATQTGTLGTTYSWINCSLGTTIVTGDDAQATIAWPFNFAFYDNTYTTANSLSVCSNGFIRLDGMANTNFTAASSFSLSATSTELGQIIAMAVYDDNVGDFGGWVRSLVTGSSPNRIFTIEYNNLEIDYNDALYADVQVSFYETSNKVVLKLGSENINKNGVDMGIHSGVANYFNKWQEVLSGTNNTWIEYIRTPTITVNPTSLTGYSYCLGSGPSTSKSFTISGSNLTGSGNITVTGSTNYNVSTNNTDFYTSVTLPYSGGIITGQPKTVYVRLKAGLAANNYNNENITFSGGGLSSPPAVSNSGTVNAIPAAPTAGNNGPVCTGSTLLLTASTISGATYSWTGPNGYTSSSQNPTVSTSATTAMTGTYYVTATVNGCSGSAGTTSVTVSAPPNISQVPVNSILYYKFSGNALDAAGTNNGTLQNAPTLTPDRFTIANKAYTFNGSSQYVSTTNYYTNPTNFTVSIWFKTATTTGGKLIGFGNAQTGSSGNYDRHIYMNNAGQIYFGVYPGYVVTINSPLAYNDNKWHLVTATLSATAGMVLYIDGTQVATNANTTAQNYAGYWRIGYDNNNGWTSQPASYYFNGTLDDALVYHTALNATQVATLYNSPDGAGNNGPVCVGTPLTLTATTVSGATYAWTGPNGFTSSSQNPTFSYSSAYAGIYAVQVSSGGCTSTAYTNVVTAAGSSTISYVGSPYCQNAGTANVTFSGTTGGTYSSTAGLTINASTGAITLGTSNAGTYTVTYTVGYGCDATAEITVTALPNASILYAGSPYNMYSGTATVSLSGTTGGTYSSTAGLSINATTGDVTLGSCTPGTYTVTYTIAASGGCSVYTTTASITVYQTKIFTGTGNFSTAARWTGGTLPVAGENFIIDGTCTVDNNAGTDNIAYGTLTIGTATGRTLNWAAGGTNRLNVSDVSAGTGSSALNMTNGGTLIIRGSWASTNLAFTPGAGTIEMQSTITLPVAYATYNNLTINGTDITVSLAAATAVNGTLTLSNGILANGAWLTMATGTTISRAQGSLLSAPTFAGTVNLVYTGSSPVTTGYEMPVSAGVLNNLTTNVGGVIQSGIQSTPVNILTDAFDNLTNWTGDIGATNNQFAPSTSTFAGGIANECRYLYGSSSTTIYTASIYRAVNTTGYTSLNISWKQFIDNWDATSQPYTIKVQCASSSGGPWTDIYSLSPTGTENIGPDILSYTNWTTNVGGTFYIRYYITGYTYGLDYWYFDDLVIEAPIADVASTVTVNGTLGLSSGTYAIGTNNLALNGAISGSSAIVGSQESNLNVGGSGSNLTIPAITNGLNNFSINRSAGVTLNGNATVNGILNLQSNNASATQGALHLGVNTLTMGASATTTGAGDVTGIVQRTSFVANIAYTFGNQFTTIIFGDIGTFPSQMQVKISIGTAPAWKTNSIKRIYEFVQTGGSGTVAGIATHYLDTELNGNGENELVHWTNGTPGPPLGLFEWGRSNFNSTDNWVAIANIGIESIPTAFGVLQNTLAVSAIAAYTWNGSISTAWGTSGNWTPSGIPSTFSGVIIPDASTTTNDPDLPTSAEIKSINIEAGGILNSVAAAQLTIVGNGGAWINQGGTFNAGTSNVTFTHAEATMSGTTNFYDVSLAPAAALIPESGTIMRIAGTLTNNGILRAGYQHNTIEYNGTNQVVINPNGATPGYHNLILSGSGTKTMPGTVLSILGDFTMSGSASATAANAASVVGNVTLGAGTSLVLGPYGYSIGGNITNNGGTFSSSTSSITLNGSEPQTMISIAGVTVNNLIISNTSANVTLGASTNCSIGGNLTIDANAVFDLAANSLTDITGSVSNSGTVITQNTSSMPVPAGKNWGGSFNFAGTGAQTMVAGTYNNLSMIGTGGATASANINVNGILNLASVNPSAIKGILDMGSNTVLMGPGSTTIGPGDVTGIVRRTSIVPEVTYTFGNQYTTIKFDDFGTLPSELSLKISIGTAPTWKPGAIQRVMEIIQTGADSTHALMYTHYLDSELNGNDENDLVDWIRIIPTSTTIEYGRSSNNTNENWVSISNANIGIFYPVFGVIQITLDESEITNLTWNGSTSTSWVTATNWTPVGSPSDHTAITIPDAGTTAFDPSLPSIATCGTMTIESGGIVNASTGAVLTINDAAGAWSNLGTFNPGNSTIIFKNSNSTMTGSTDFYNLTTDAGAVITLGNNAYVGIAGTFTNTGAMNTVGNGATTVEYKGGDQTVVVPNRTTNTYSNLILSGSGTKTMPATALNIVGNFTMSGTASATAGTDMTFAGDFSIGVGTSFSTGNFYHTVAGNFTNDGSFNASTGNTIKMNGTSSQVLGGTATTTFDNLIIDNSYGVMLSGMVNVNIGLTLASGNLTTGATTLGMNGIVSKTAGSLEVGSSTSLSFGGTSEIILANDLFTAPPSINNLTINRAGGVTLGNQSITINGLLDLTAGTFSLGANSLTIAGISPTRTSGNLNAGNASTIITFTNTAAITLPDSIFSVAINNLTINGSGGLTSGGDFTVNGILNLQSANPSALKGSLDLWDGTVMKTLTMGASATTIGAGDVTGIIRRTAFVAHTTYTFGNPFTTVTFHAGGTYPSQMQVKISIGTSPSWKTDAIKRIYDTQQTGGNNCLATLGYHYLDAELNGNDENVLVHWVNGTPGPPLGLNEFGRSAFSTSDNWVSMDNVSVGYLPTSFGVLESTLSKTELASYTWNGSESTLWTSLANWTPWGTPSSLSIVIIPDSATTLNDPNLPAVTEIKSISIENDGMLNAIASEQLTINGDNGAWVNFNGTFNAGNSNVIFTNASATISGTTDFYDVTINSGAGLYVTSGNTMRIAGSMTNTGTWHADIGVPTTVEYNGGDQSIVVPDPATSSYSNLILSGSGIKTFPVTELTIHGNLDVTGTASANILDIVTVNEGVTIGTGSNLSVFPTAKLTVSGTFINETGSGGLVLLSDPTGTASLLHNTDNVPATVERYISGAAEDWHFLSSPVSNQPIADGWLPTGTYGNGTGYDLYLWNEPTSCWIYNLNTNSDINWVTTHPGYDFIVGRGYLYSVQASNPTKTFAGNLNNDTVSYGLTIGGTDLLVQGFNFVGNPYASSIDWMAASGWTHTDLVESGGGYNMWIWNPAANNYGVYNSVDPDGIGTNSVTRYIAPMQGFFVQAAQTGNLGMSNTIRVHDGAGNWFKNQQKQATDLNLRVSSHAGLGSDEVLLEFGYPEKENGAKKLFSHVTTAPSLYMTNALEDLTVGYFTSPDETMMVPVNFTPGTAGDFTISCRFDTESFTMVWLEDRKENYYQDLNFLPEYTFSAKPSDNADRFLLHFGTIQPQANKELPARIYYNGNEMVVDLSLIDQKANVQVVDLLGRVLLNTSAEGKMINKFTISTIKQVFIVYVSTNSASVCRKILIY